MSVTKTTTDPEPTAETRERTSAIERFQRHLSVAASDATSHHYAFIAGKFLETLETPLAQATGDDVTRWLSLYIEGWRRDHPSTKSRPDSTVRTYSFALRAFYKFLGKDERQIPLPKAPKKERKFLVADQVNRLIDAARPDHRDYALIVVLAFSGLRISEVASLRPQDVNPSAKTLFVEYGKGAKDRTVDVPPRVIEAIDTWRTVRDQYPLRDPAKDHLLFRLGIAAVAQIVKRLVQEASLPSWVTAHTLRHSYATALLVGGTDIRYIADQLGHGSIATTQVYAHVIPAEKRAKIQAVASDLYKEGAGPKGS